MTGRARGLTSVDSRGSTEQVHPQCGGQSAAANALQVHLLSQRTPQPVELVPYARVVHLIRTRTREHNQVDRFIKRMVSELFPYQPLDAVAPHGTTNGLFSHNDTQS